MVGGGIGARGGAKRVLHTCPFRSAHVSGHVTPVHSEAHASACKGGWSSTEGCWRGCVSGASARPDYCPTTEAECSSILRQAVVLLKTNNSSGYSHVFPVKGQKPLQAKPYIRPKVQRSLGSFHTAEEAAMAVVSHALGILPTPPTPPARNRRGEGRRPRDRRKKRPAAEAADVQVRYECAIGSEDEDGVQWYE